MAHVELGTLLEWSVVILARWSTVTAIDEPLYM